MRLAQNKVYGVASGNLFNRTYFGPVVYPAIVNNEFCSLFFSLSSPSFVFFPLCGYSGSLFFMGPHILAN